MIEFKPTQRKRIIENKKDYSRQYNEESTTISRHQDNFQNTLNSNYSQIKELIRERKILLQKKADNLFRNNQNKLQAILTARDSDLKNEARSLGDRDAMQLIENSEGLDGPRVLLQKIATINNIGKYESVERENGKAFWDSHKEFQRQMKKRSEIYVNQSKQLKGVHQKQRSIFIQIQRLQNQMIALLTKARKDPDHIKKAQKFNEEIEKRKMILKQTKRQKEKLKATILQTIGNILEFNEKNEAYSKRRYKQLDEIFGGSQTLSEFDQFLHSLQTIIENKGRDSKGQEAQVNHLQKLIKDYDILYEEIEKMHEEEANIFNKITQSLNQNTKFALLQKIYLSGISNKQDQYQLLKKCQLYRKLLSDLEEDRPMISQTLKKITKMNNALIPLEKAYNTQDTRKQQLKRELKKLCTIHRDLEERARDLRNFAFKMEQLMRSREEVESELNACADRGNLAQYKSKVSLLQQIDKDIEKERNRSSSTQIKKQQQFLLNQLQKINENYEDIIEEIIVQDKKMYLGTYLDKLEKRLSLV